MLQVHLVEAPRQTALAAYATTLRAKLKDWEKSFAALHSGQKPSKEDIKACLEIAKTYKKYNRVRAMLAGKTDVKILEPATASSRTISKAEEEREDAGGKYSDLEIREDAVQVSTPRTTKVSLIRRPSPPHPNTLDPY